MKLIRLDGMGSQMEVYLIDGTYELFRHYFALPSRQDSAGREVGALVGVLGSVLGMIRDGATHLGVATDHVVESFRNAMSVRNCSSPTRFQAISKTVHSITPRSA